MQTLYKNLSTFKYQILVVHREINSFQIVFEFSKSRHKRPPKISAKNVWVTSLRWLLQKIRIDMGKKRLSQRKYAREGQIFSASLACVDRLVSVNGAPSYLTAPAIHPLRSAQKTLSFAHVPVFGLSYYIDRVSLKTEDKVLVELLFT